MLSILYALKTCVTISTIWLACMQIKTLLESDDCKLSIHHNMYVTLHIKVFTKQETTMLYQCDKLSLHVYLTYLHVHLPGLAWYINLLSINKYWKFQVAGGSIYIERECQKRRYSIFMLVYPFNMCYV